MVGQKRKNFFVLGVFNLTPKPMSVAAHKKKKKCKVKCSVESIKKAFLF
jgi:hypothetical protein